jgi:hypothetical protein
MNWADIRPALLQLVETLTEDGTAVWADQPQPYIDPSCRYLIRLSLGPVRTLGVTDDRQVDFDAARPLNQELGDTLITIRALTLTLLAESLSQQDGETAWTYLERVRGRLYRRSSLAAFREVGCALISSGEVQDLSLPVDDRQTSRAALDLRIRSRTSEVDPVRYGYIATIEATATLKHGVPPDTVIQGNLTGILPP